MIYPEHLTAWLCGLISTDGYVTKKKNRWAKSGYQIEVCVTSAKDRSWAEQIVNHLESHNISVTLNRYDNDDGISGPHTIFKVYLCKYHPKGKRHGTDQHKSLIDSIVHWQLSDLMMNRKFQILSSHQ